VAIAKQDPAENKAAIESVGVGSKISSAQARQLRLSSLTVEPGGIVELHRVKDRPTVLHVIRGTLVSQPHGVVLARRWPRPRSGRPFWIENTGSEPAEFIWLPLDQSSP
jgi:hypothetical protein